MTSLTHLVRVLGDGGVAAAHDLAVNVARGGRLAA
jgi:hypothetical protein